LSNQGKKKHEGFESLAGSFYMQSQTSFHGCNVFSVLIHLGFKQRMVNANWVLHMSEK